MSSRYVVVYPDAVALAYATAARLLTHLTDVLALQETAHVALTGGSVGVETLRQVAGSQLKDNIDWDRVHLWWSDERFLSAGHEDRNEVQAHHALIDHIAIPTAHVHVIAAESDRVPDAETAAGDYRSQLSAYAQPGRQVPQFDIVLLGMGPDAHIASLFPGHEALLVTDVTVSAVYNSPKPPPTRITFTFETINSATEVWIVAAGSEKAEAVEAGLFNAPVSQAPVGHVRGTMKTLWLLDAAAAGTKIS